MNMEPHDEELETPINVVKEDHAEYQYLNIMKKIMDKAEAKDNRTGDVTYVVSPQVIVHDVGKYGFPLITTKQVGIKTVARELQWFIGGQTSKAVLRDRKCNIWNEWANPDIINKIDFNNKTSIQDACHVYSVDELEFKTLADVKFDEGKTTEESRRLAFQELLDDLGPVYGFQWRRFNREYVNGRTVKHPIPPAEPGYENNVGDQLAYVVNTLKSNPNDRRLHVSAWNPLQKYQQALPPCHLSFTVQHINGTLHLVWHQRSCDLFLGAPFNLASYALLLMLLCKETGMEPGTVTGQLTDTHIYHQHFDVVNDQIKREPYQCPTLTIDNWTNIWEWDADDVSVEGYECHGKLTGRVSV